MRRVKARNEEMGDAYKQRVGQFIKKMIQQPIQIPDRIKNEG